MSEIQNLKFLFPPRVKGVKVFDSEALYPVGKIYCIGKNYADHAKEMGGAVDRDQPFFLASRLRPSLSQILLLFRLKLIICIMRLS